MKTMNYFQNKSKDIVACLFVAIFSIGFFACSESDNPVSIPPGNISSLSSSSSSHEKKEVINLWTFSDEVPKMIVKYMETHPEFKEKYDVITTIIPTTEGNYEPALDKALMTGGLNAPDFFCADAAFVLKYTQGEMSNYAAPYKTLGIDIDKAINDADIAKYSVEVGTNPSGDVVGLCYQGTGGAFIYRRSIAKDVFGSDDPATVAEKIGAGTGKWDKFFDAAEELKAKGYAIVSGDGDIWHGVENSANEGWVVDDKLTIDVKREEFLDLSKKLKDNNYHNDTEDWSEAWKADMRDEGEKGVLGFLGPAWFINNILTVNSGGSKVGEGTFGDWGVCEPNVGFFWGGTWLIANTNSSQKEAVGELINWITLDCSQDGLQYMLANGCLNEEGTKDGVASGTVMAMSDGSLEFLGGQNMFDVFIPANQFAIGKNLTQYDEKINLRWRGQVRQYSAGYKGRDAAIKDFKQEVADELDIK